jgi:hypothetical protein
MMEAFARGSFITPDSLEATSLQHAVAAARCELLEEVRSINYDELMKGLEDGND